VAIAVEKDLVVIAPPVGQSRQFAQSQQIVTPGQSQGFVVAETLVVVDFVPDVGEKLCHDQLSSQR
jgi:hypothetical protein